VNKYAQNGSEHLSSFPVITSFLFLNVLFTNYQTYENIWSDYIDSYKSNYHMITTTVAPNCTPHS
jgi:hypothetical protein